MFQEWIDTIKASGEISNKVTRSTKTAEKTLPPRVRSKDPVREAMARAMNNDAKDFFERIGDVEEIRKNSTELYYEGEFLPNTREFVDKVIYFAIRDLTLSTQQKKSLHARCLMAVEEKTKGTWEIGEEELIGMVKNIIDIAVEFAKPEDPAAAAVTIIDDVHYFNVILKDKATPAPVVEVELPKAPTEEPTPAPTPNFRPD